MDTSVRPQDNFYRFMNGNWLEETDIPADRARWGSFDELREQSQEHVLEIILELSEDTHAHGSDGQKIGDMFRSFMDTLAIEQLGLEPISSDLARIDALQSHDTLPEFWGYNQRYRFGSPVSVYVGLDLMQSDQYITSGTQSGLGLPDRDFYLRDDDRSLQLLDAYRTYITRLWDAAAWGDGEDAANRIIALETALAEQHWTRVQNRDRQATYNKMTVTELTETAPGFDWLRLLDQAGLGDVEEIVIRQPSYFESFADMWREVELNDWKTYLRFHLLRSTASNLSSTFADIHFDFYGRALSGLEEQRTRERRAVSSTESTLGFLVGKKYVDRHYPQEAADRMADMIDNLKVAFEESIHELDWMTDDTKQEALAKLANFNAKIGYPEVWRDYDCLEIFPDDLIGNLRRASLCEYERSTGRLGQEVDREEWGMTPQTVNAYYNVVLNEIVFPAAILQPPFFNVDADDAVNYGGIGAVIGHEITHGFDDQGRRSDGDGNLRDWWTQEDEEQFQARAQLMIEQYNAFNPIEDLHINGELALGENIADLGGMNVALRAWRNSLEGAESPVIDGFTGEQRFFMGWGQIWRIKFRDESLRQQLVTGPHSPGKYRVLGILSNMPEFYEAFEVQPGDPMYREEDIRVRIW
ncbi:M13 family metallopeptidase [Balneolales bacterium ANBcel1]|nr:M13 family metallopeptidase [Balneolales bacterium ANBcel1]